MVAEIEKARNRGSAAKLLGEQKVLYIFVDDNGATPWTRDLRVVVETKIEQAMRWIESQAKKRGLNVHMEHRCLPLGPLVACPTGLKINEADGTAGPHHSTWNNVVATGLTRWGTLAERWDELFRLAGIPLSGTEGSAIFFCVRRYTCSIAFPVHDGENLEFEKERGIIYDNGGTGGQIHLASLMVHELFHLYGAVDLRPDAAHNALTDYATNHLDDVMHTPTQKPLGEYKIGDLTEYLIGWSETKPACLIGA